jgi:rhodanese-related sulfurtransferase
MTVKKKFITCEQLYEIWSSEPEVISIFDLRDIQSFNELRIPGSISMTEDKLENALGTIGNNLAVLVGSSVEDEKKILQKLTLDGHSIQRCKPLYTTVPFLLGLSVGSVSRIFGSFARKIK